MDFSYNEIQTMLADSVAKFIDNEYDFDTRQSYAASDKGYSDEIWSMFAELGWTAVPFSEEDGGFGGFAGRGCRYRESRAGIEGATCQNERAGGVSQNGTHQKPLVDRRVAPVLS